MAKERILIKKRLGINRANDTAVAQCCLSSTATMQATVLLLAAILVAFVALPGRAHAQASSDKISGSVVTRRPSSPTTTSSRRPTVRKQECTKQPPNFREINLPCGGYDRTGCLQLCQKLGYPKFYCRKEEFCLCHSGDLYSC